LIKPYAKMKKNINFNLQKKSNVTSLRLSVN